MTGINRDDWLRAVGDAERVRVDASDAWTLRELQDVFGVTLNPTKARVRRLIAAGRAVETWKTIRGSDGRVMRVRAYRLVPDDAKPSGSDVSGESGRL